MKFYLCTFGCRVNQADGDAIADALRRDGHEETDDPALAALVVINTCTVTHRSDHDARNRVRRLHRANPAARIVVAGCYPERDPAALTAIPGVAAVLGTRRAQTVARLAAQWESGPAAGEAAPPALAGDPPRAAARAGLESPGDGPDEAPLPVAVARRGHTRPFVKIQDGCAGNCAYCIVPSVRGAPRSADPGEVVERVAELAGQGTREIILTGIHLGLYGRDRRPPTSLAALAGTLMRRTSIGRLRFSSIEPPEFDEDLLALIGGEPRIAPHFHVPLQSGSERTLRRMNRTYGPGEYRRVVGRLAGCRPRAAIGADVIVGFPGETDADFLDSLDFVASLPLAYLHVFPFSPRPGTPAAAFPDPVDPRVVRDRAARFLALGKTLSRDFRRSLAGVELPALVLGRRTGKTTGARALTENYVPVVLPGADLPLNADVRVVIETVSPAGECRARLSGPLPAPGPGPVPDAV